MRILMLSWEYPPRIVGGISRVVYYLAKELGAAGHQVTVLTMTDENLLPFQHDGVVSVYRVPAWSVRPITFIDSIMQMNMEMVAAGVRLMQNGEKFDVLHMHDWLVAFAGKTLLSLYPFMTGVATIHATEYGRNAGIHNDVQNYISSVEKKLVTEISKTIIVNSAYMKNEVLRLFQPELSSIDVISNGIDLNRYDDVKVDQGFRRTHALDTEKIVFFVGRLTYEKGVYVLMDAIPKILARYQDVKFVIAGKGQELDALKQRAWNMGIAHRVDFPGFISDNELLCMYRIADIAVFPSLYEPFGIVALEGMVARLPVVVSDIGGLDEIIEDRRNGMKFPAGNSDRLAESVVTLLNDEPLRASIGENAYRTIEERFLWPHIAGLTIKTYERACAKTREKIE